MTVNKVILVGNLGRDPEIRSTNSGMKIANLNIATTERRKQADGNWGDHTEWHRVTAFGRLAETAERFLTKGRQIYVEGKLRTSKYQDRETGKDRYSTDIIADDIRFLGNRSDSGHTGNRADSGYANQGGGGGGFNQGGYDQGGYDERDTGQSGAGGSSNDDDDIPF